MYKHLLFYYYYYYYYTRGTARKTPQSKKFATPLKHQGLSMSTFYLK